MPSGLTAARPLHTHTHTLPAQMGGTADAIIPPAAQPELAQHIPGAWLAQFPGAGHGFLWEAPDQVAAVMDAFLDESHGEAVVAVDGGAAAEPPTPPAVSATETESKLEL